MQDQYVHHNKRTYRHIETDRLRWTAIRTHHFLLVNSVHSPLKGIDARNIVKSNKLIRTQMGLVPMEVNERSVKDYVERLLELLMGLRRNGDGLHAR